MHEINADIGAIDTPPWLTAAVAGGIRALEWRLSVELIMDEIDAARLGPRTPTSDRRARDQRECEPSAG